MLVGWALCTAALLAVPAPAQAGRAQVGIGMGTWATTDLDSATASGQSWRDGLLLQTLSDAATPPADDSAQVSLLVSGVPRSSSASAQVQAQAALHSNGAGFSGGGHVASDVTAGTLALQWRSSLATAPAPAGGVAGEGFARGYPLAELWETFEVLYPLDRVAPVQVTLSLHLAGTLAGNDGRAGQRDGVDAFLALGGVHTGEAHNALDPVWRSEGAVAGDSISFTGALQPTGCSVGRGVCSGFVSLYAALDLRGLVPGAPPEAWQPALAPLDLAFTGQLHLQLSGGVRLVRGDVSDPLSSVAWAQVGTVPEPATAASLLAGLLLLALRRRPRASLSRPLD